MRKTNRTTTPVAINTVSDYEQQLIAWLQKVIDADGTTTAFQALQKKAKLLIDTLQEAKQYKIKKQPYNTNKNNIVKISEPEGKMENICTISTVCIYNIYCIARIYKYRYNSDIACSNCFSAESGPLSFKNTIKPYIYNSIIFSQSIIPVEQLPELNCLICRFESHGDIINLNHIINYINICIKNPDTKFTLWTKNDNLLKTAFQKYGKPENLTVIHSSLELNRAETEAPEKYKFIDKTFTVFSYEYAKTNNQFIGCGGRSCVTCQKCYKNAETSEIHISELLKQDAKKNGYINEREGVNV